MAIPARAELEDWQRLLALIRPVIPRMEGIWTHQAAQYPPLGVPNHVVPFNPADWVYCLLWYDAAGTLAGILNYYPKGYGRWESPKAVNVLVRPDQRRHGIGRQLLQEALVRWEVPLFMQRYTPEGLALVRRLVDELVEASKEE